MDFTDVLKLLLEKEGFIAVITAALGLFNWIQWRENKKVTAAKDIAIEKAHLQSIADLERYNRQYAELAARLDKSLDMVVRMFQDRELLAQREVIREALKDPDHPVAPEEE